LEAILKIDPYKGKITSPSPAFPKVKFRKKAGYYSENKF
jgi:hypothetical protein